MYGTLYNYANLVCMVIIPKYTSAFMPTYFSASKPVKIDLSFAILAFLASFT